MTNDERFRLITRISGGHRYWHDREFAATAISDDSGHYPTETDDGVLWLDLKRPVSLQRDHAGGPTFCLVPLLSPDGRQSSSPASPAEAFWVASYFNLPIRIDNGPEKSWYRVSRTATET